MDGFLLAYDGFDPGMEGLREALTSTGNGYLCTRGAAEWEEADGVHYPGTYAHGGYNRETTILGGLPVLNEDLVNLPNWLVLTLRIEGEDAIRLAERFRHSISREPFETCAGKIDVTTSVGVAVIPNVDASWPLLKAADDALYRAKAAGRNTVAFAA